MKKVLNALILMLIINSIAVNYIYANVDSIGTEVVSGKRYILHKVEKSEGLYGIARKYKTTVSAIQESNNLSNTILDLGMILKIPVPNITSQNPSIKESPKPKLDPQKIITNPKINTTAYITHSVKRGETLYSISRKYDVSVTEISELNKLKKTSLSFGQKLKIPKKGTVIENRDIEEPTGTEPVLVEKTTGTATNKVSTKENKLLGSMDYNESGMASWVEDKNIDSKKSIALHRTAPLGTIIRVTNLMNNKSIYVKVIGRLPDTGDNENLVIILSKASANILGAIDQKFRVNLNYSIPK